jgi:hypothetical protein
MKNLYLIATDKPSRLYEFGGEYHLQIKSQENFRSQNIYITSDEEINQQTKPCLCINTIKNTWDADLIYYQGSMPLYHYKGFKKIILTTDQDLIKYGIQAIDDTFLEWFVKNPSCEKVEIRDYKLHFGSTIYKIIIPQEEPQFVTVNIDSATGEDLGKVSYIPLPNVDYVPKQETLEEAAEKQWGKLAIINDRAAVIAFKAGAKWQAERMYSEEDMREAFIAGTQFEEDYDYNLYMEKWFEQFKKK